MKNNFDIIYADAFSSANGSGALKVCYSICNAKNGDIQKALCNTKYIAVPCAWNCSKHPDKACCKHNKKGGDDRDQCRKNIDNARHKCESDCDAEALNNSIVDTPVDTSNQSVAPTTTIPSLVAPSNTTRSSNTNKQGVFSGMSNGTKIWFGIGGAIILALGITISIQIAKDKKTVN